MIRAALAMAFAGWLATAAHAAESEQLDEEFLEYLAEFTDAEDDWTWFASDAEEEAPKPVKAPEKQAAKPAEQRAEKVKP